MFSASRISTMAMTRKEIVEAIGKRSTGNLPFSDIRHWIDKQTCCISEVPLRRAKQKIWLVRFDHGLRWLAVSEAEEQWQGGTCYVKVVGDTGTVNFQCVPICVENQEVSAFLKESGLPIKIKVANHKRNRQTIKRHPVAFVH